MAFAMQPCSIANDIDGDHLGLGIGLDDRQQAVADGGANLQDARRREIQHVAAHPLHHAVAAAVGEPAELTAGGGEQPVVVICRTGDVAFEQLGVVAAGHAMVVDGADVARDGQGGIEFQAGIPVGQLLGAGGKLVRLAQCHPAPGLLALLHGHPPQRRPGLKHRLAEQSTAQLMAIGRRPSVRGDEAPLAPRAPGGAHMRQHAAGKMTVHMGEKVEPGGFVVRHLRKHPMTSDGAIIRRPVIIRPIRRNGGGGSGDHGCFLAGAILGQPWPAPQARGLPYPNCGHAPRH